MTRITYSRHPDRNIWYSKQYLANAIAVNATIIHRDSDNKYQVIVHDLSNGVVLYEQLCISFNSAKKVVKNTFKKYGVEFYAEVRKKIEQASS